MKIYSWSISKETTFNFCKKKYYLNYLRQYDEQNFFDDSNEIIILKKLRNRFAFRKKIISNTINLIISDRMYGFENDEKFYVQSAIKELSEIIVKSNNLFEKYYNINHTIDYVKFYYETGICIENFIRSDIFSQIKRTQMQNIFLVNLDQSNINATPVFTLNQTGIQISGGPDLYILENKNLKIYNWKMTGNNSKDCDYRTAAAISYLYLKNLLSYEFDKYDLIQIYFFFIPENKTIVLDDKKELKKVVENFQKNLKTSIINLKNADSESEDFFSKTQDTDNCRFCNFKKLCRF